jgi:hypothetical protein
MDDNENNTINKKPSTVYWYVYDHIRTIFEAMIIWDVLYYLECVDWDLLLRDRGLEDHMTQGDPKQLGSLSLLRIPPKKNIYIAELILDFNI